MRKGLTIFGIIFIIIIVFGEFVLPQLAVSTIKTRLENRLASRDVTLTMDSSPQIFLAMGRMDTIQAVAHNAKLGEVNVSELTLTGRNVHLDMAGLLQDSTLELKSADEFQLKGIVTEDNLHELITRKVDKLENVQVQITPEEAVVTANLKVFGRMADVDLRGIVLEDGGSLYFRMTKLQVKNAFPGKLNLNNFFGDIQIVKPGKLPLGAEFDQVIMQDGSVTITAHRK